MTEPIHVIWWKFQLQQSGPEGDLWYPNPVKCHQTTMLSEVFPDSECIYLRDFDALPPNTGAIVVLSGGAFLGAKLAWIERAIPALQDRIALLPWVVIASVYDVESAFRLDLLRHPNMKIWVQEPKPGVNPTCTVPAIGMLNHNAFRRIPVGYTRSALTFLPEFKQEMENKSVEWYFAGRSTDSFRMDWTEAIQNLPNAATQYFPEIRDGDNNLKKCLSTQDYMRGFAEAKVVPCRPSPCTPETARVYDALEAGCVPIVPCVAGGEGWNIRYDWTNYWEYVFGEPPPFPVIKSPQKLAAAVNDALAGWPGNARRISEWWLHYKKRLALELRADVDRVRMLSQRGGISDAVARGEIVRFGSHVNSDVTAIVPTSPTPSNPKTELLEETLASIRFHLPTAKIVLLFDGVRGEQEAMRENYEEYKRRILWNCSNLKDWWGVTWFEFSSYTHQAAMTRKALKFVTTPLILFVEHDTPLLAKEIPWASLAAMIIAGDCNLVRFPPDGEDVKEFMSQKFRAHLMLDKVDARRTSVIRTIQWSQRPHLASTDYYRSILRNHFTEEDRTFIEWRMDSVVQSAPWEQHKIVIYAPIDGPIARSYHLDGRENASVFPEL